ncbi:hypothetical protein GIB67_025800 [Kingdonia uniflora]|uniref:Uncharacterized protein n=1 Tax=Kingdonia uniflora TaxID=39325 RepID=A0A7J7NSF0_9MAGN|nr:hypothetical protein GIB67_025800 [Kingdonia uniflora]
MSILVPAEMMSPNSLTRIPTTSKNSPMQVVYSITDDILNWIEKPYNVDYFKEINVQLTKLVPLIKNPVYLYLICVQLLSKLRKFVHSIRSHHKADYNDLDMKNIRRITLSLVYKLHMCAQVKKLKLFIDYFDVKAKKRTIYDDFIVNNPAHMLNSLFSMGEFGFKNYIPEMVAKECRYKIMATSNILIHHPYLVPNFNNLDYLIRHNVDNMKEGARDSLIEFLEQINVDKLEDESMRPQLKKDIVDLKQAISQCKYTEKERQMPQVVPVGGLLSEA